MKFVKSVSLTLSSRILGIFLGILASVIVARYLGPSGKGVLAVLAVISGLAVQLGNFGLHASTTYFVARDKSILPELAPVALYTSISIGCLIALGFGLIYVLYPQGLPNIPSLFLILTLIAIPFLLLSLFFQGILLGQQRVTAYNLVDLAGKALGLFLIAFLLMYLGRDLLEVLLAGLLTGAITGLALAYSVMAEIRIVFAFDRGLFIKMLRYGFKPYTSCLLAYLVVRSDMLLVNYFLGQEQAGLYSVAVSLADLLILFPTSIGVVLFPTISAHRSDDSIFTAKVTRHTVILTAMICALLGVTARSLITAMYGQRFVGSVEPFLWLLPGIFFLGVEMVIAQDLAARGYPFMLVVIWGIGLAINVILNVFLIPAWGISGAAFSSTITYGFVFISVFAYFCRFTKSSLRNTLVIQLADLKALKRFSPVHPTEIGPL